MVSSSSSFWIIFSEILGWLGYWQYLIQLSPTSHQDRWLTWRAGKGQTYYEMELNDDHDHHYNFNLQQSLWGCNKVNDIIGDITFSVNNNLRRSQSVGFKWSLISKMLSCHVTSYMLWCHYTSHTSHILLGDVIKFGEYWLVFVTGSLGLSEPIWQPLFASKSFKAL